MRLATLAKRTNRSLAPIYRSLYFPPAVIFLAIFFGVLLAWQNAQTTLQQSVTTAADSRANASDQILREHFLTYDQMLRGGVGLFEGSDAVTLKEWERAIQSFQSGQNLPDLLSVGFIKVFTADQIPALTRYMETQGIDNFKVTPENPPRNEFASLLYITPLEPARYLPYGYDAYTDPARRATMFRARDQNTIAMTAPLPHIIKYDEPLATTKGFTMYIPYYNRELPTNTAAERRAALLGYINASFNANTFFDSLVPADPKGAGVQVTTKNDSGTSTLYTSHSFNTINELPGKTSVVRRLNIHGQAWDMHYVYDTRTLVSKEQLNRPTLVLLFGTISAALLSAVVYLLLRTRAQDLSAQKEQAVELAKDELLSLASHQLRTPATGVKQYVGMVLQGFAGRVTASQRSLLEKAYASNDRQLRIINEILHLAKIGSGRIVLAKQPTNLGDLITDITNEQRHDIDSARHQVTIHTPDDPVTVFSDTHMLRMAIENILSNSIKYTPQGGKIDIRVRTDKSKAYVTIADTGVGIKPGDKEKIFRQFSRLPNEMSQHVGGTGIGLYLAKHLVELHKGSIEVESEQGKGSTFTIALPLAGSSSGSMRNLTVTGKGKTIINKR
jgi:signal transduction histidine kinase